MKLSATYQTRRSAFTLIELLVVMTILALLVALLAAGVFKTLNKVADVKNTRELRDLRTGIVNFQAKYKVGPIPSRIHLRNDLAYDTSLTATGQPTNQLDYDSASYLTGVWHYLTAPVNWNPNTTNTDVTLEGDQCLVFFLGGIQGTVNGVNACVGFSTNPKDPTALGGDRVEPFFDFQSDRLTTKFDKAKTGYFSYLDAYGKAPFAYFSSYKKANGYNRYLALYKNSDCLNLGVWPYYDGIKYQNSDTFQIISAGRDGVFGPGYDWTSASPLTWTPATADKNIPPAGRDDMADFYDRMLGVPTN
jgi:prepilin-type N-terminal cleavage/methylation domain-containing protein